MSSRNSSRASKSASNDADRGLVTAYIAAGQRGERVGYGGWEVVAAEERRGQLLRLSVLPEQRGGRATRHTARSGSPIPRRRRRAPSAHPRALRQSRLRLTEPSSPRSGDPSYPLARLASFRDSDPPPAGATHCPRRVRASATTAPPPRRRCPCGSAVAAARPEPRASEPTRPRSALPRALPAHPSRP